MRRGMIIVVLTMALLVVSTSAQALIINEVEDNNSVGTAQNINSFFSLGANPDIVNATTVPWVSILGTGNNTWDYYSFSVGTAGSTGVFDVDYGLNAGGSFDAWLVLLNGNGSQITYNDDSSILNGAGGSVHPYDSFIQYAFSQAGDYAVAVGRYPGYEILNGGTYTLQVSVENHSLSQGETTVPEPATMLLFSTGLLGAFFRRRK